MTHRERFPEQYTHPLVGRTVRLLDDPQGREFVVERVVPSQFGPLIVDPDNHRLAYGVGQYEDTTPPKPPPCPECSGREWAIYRTVDEITYYNEDGKEDSRSTSDCFELNISCSGCGHDPRGDDDNMALFDAVLALEDHQS